MKPSFAGLVGLLCLVSCFMPAVPSTYQLSCASDNVCPGGFTCVSGCCVPPGGAPSCVQNNCTPTCTPGSCGASDGCGGTCGCATGETCITGSCCANPQACGTTCCDASYQVCVTDSSGNNPTCVTRCTTSTDCSSPDPCCWLLTDNTTKQILPYGGCVAWVTGRFCVCASTSDCAGLSAAPACSPLTTSTYPDPQRGWPYICKANDGNLYDGCNGITCNQGCCVSDANSNAFCAAACTSNSNCNSGGGNCHTDYTSVCGSQFCGP